MPNRPPAPRPAPCPDSLSAAAARRLLPLARLLEAMNDRLGRAVAWLALGMVLATLLVVVLRYAFDTGAIALQESVLYMHALLFMLGIGYTLRHEGHVRVDILYQRWSRRGRAWVDLLGTALLLVPVCLFMLLVSFDYVAESWAIREGSRDAGGLPWVWLLKTLLLLMPALVLAQGVVWLIRNGLFLLGCEAALPPPPPADAGHPEEAAPHG